MNVVPIDETVDVRKTASGRRGVGGRRVRVTGLRGVRKAVRPRVRQYRCVVIVEIELVERVARGQGEAVELRLKRGVVELAVACCESRRPRNTRQEGDEPDVGHV